MIPIGFLFIIGVIIIIMQNLFQKESFIFVGTMGDKFELAGNWSTRRLPSPIDDVFIMRTSYPKITIKDDIWINSFIVEKGWEGILTMEGNMTISGNLWCSAEMYSTGDGIITLSSIKGYGNVGKIDNLVD